MRLKPPLSILKAAYSSYGCRLVKRPKEKRPKHQYTYPGYSHYSYNSYNTNTNNTAIVPARTKNFDDEEYVLFYGSEAAMSNWSACRVCLKHCWSKSERTIHLADSSHDIVMYRAIRRLQEFKKCVVCGADTSGKLTYRVPLCDDNNCLDIWRHQESMMYGREALMDALEYTGYNPEKDVFQA